MMLGPGIIMAGSAIGTGEWLLGPLIAARYGGALLWIATMSLTAQLIYNMEVSRYALYTGEPIFTGKFRLLPGPAFWLVLYLILDFGSILPYQLAGAATTGLSMFLGRIPDPSNDADGFLLKSMTYVVLVIALLPLLFGGKVYNSLKVIITVKIVVVLGFLLLLAIFFSSSDTWVEIATGFFRFGTIPIDKNSGAVENIFVSLFNGRGIPHADVEAIAILTTFAAIAGIGGLTQATISNYTRDQGWGMGKKVGAIPGMFGRMKIELSHTGSVFNVSKESIGRWKKWKRFVLKDQLFVWLPAALIGIALPSMLSVEFLPRGTIEKNHWVIAGMTAGGVEQRVGGSLGQFCWYMIMFCGFLVLVPSAAVNADAFIRRWLDASWTALKSFRNLKKSKIRIVYFCFLLGYFAVSVFFLSINQPKGLIIAYANVSNLALGISSWHTLRVNCTLLPRELRPRMGSRIALFSAGLYFFLLALLSAAISFGLLT
jgi:signal transduction histidine kinase